MPRDVSPAIVAALETWAAQKRGPLIEVQSVVSVLGRIKTERIAAGSPGAVRGQRWPEVYVGDGLRVQRVVRIMRELPRLTLTYYYVLRWPWRVPISDQAVDLGLTKREYWRHLEVAEAIIDGALAVMDVTPDRAPSPPARYSS